MVGCSISIAVPTNSGFGAELMPAPAGVASAGLGRQIDGLGEDRRSPRSVRRGSRFRRRIGVGDGEANVSVANDGARFGCGGGQGAGSRTAGACGCRVRLSKNSASTRRSSGLKSIKSGGSTAASSSRYAGALRRSADRSDGRRRRRGFLRCAVSSGLAWAWFGAGLRRSLGRRRRRGSNVGLGAEIAGKLGHRNQQLGAALGTGHDRAGLVRGCAEELIATIAAKLEPLDRHQGPPFA